jgi:hypothetical protein
VGIVLVCAFGQFLEVATHSTACVFV